MDFTSWDASLRSDTLEHHGIRGMHWGVRRYQNEDGSLTALGKERYGSMGGSNVSARKMQRDFNRLDKSYANVTAEHRFNAKKTAQLSRKAHKLQRRGKTEKAQKILAKAQQMGAKAALNNKQRKAIESLQWKIIGKAATAGYTTTSKPVIRMANTGRQRAIAAGLGVLIGGGAIYGAVSGAVLARKAVKVSGQKVSIKKHGSGGTSIVNYSAGKKTYQQEQNQEAARNRRHYYNRG